MSPLQCVHVRACACVCVGAQAKDYDPNEHAQRERGERTSGGGSTSPSHRPGSPTAPRTPTRIKLAGEVFALPRSSHEVMAAAALGPPPPPPPHGVGRSAGLSPTDRISEARDGRTDTGADGVDAADAAMTPAELRLQSRLDEYNALLEAARERAAAMDERTQRMMTLRTASLVPHLSSLSPPSPLHRLRPAGLGTTIHGTLAAAAATVNPGKQACT